MAGGRRMVATGDVQLTIAAMEPRPDGRGKDMIVLEPVDRRQLPQWSPGLMAGGRCGRSSSSEQPPLPQWSPGLMAGGRRLPRPTSPPETTRRNGAPA